MDVKGDPAKQPEDCKSVFIPFGEDDPKGIYKSGYWTQCPNLREVSTSMDKETYQCDVCGERYNLYYEDMK